MIMIASLFTTCSKNEISSLTLPGAENVIPGSYKVNYYDDGTGAGNARERIHLRIHQQRFTDRHQRHRKFQWLWAIAATNASDVYDQGAVTIVIDGKQQYSSARQSWFVKKVTDVTLRLKDDAAAQEVHFIKIWFYWLWRQY